MITYFQALFIQRHGMISALMIYSFSVETVLLRHLQKCVVKKYKIIVFW